MEKHIDKEEFTQEQLQSAARLRLMLQRKWEEGFKEALVQVCRNPQIPKPHRDRLGFAIGACNKRLARLDELAKGVTPK